MKLLPQLFESNREWAAKMVQEDPAFFQRLSRQQAPEFLWIGCADSRVPANQILGLLPGEIFVHRNVANLVTPADINCLSVVQYAVEVLQVKHIIVCGHYSCGGVRAALGDRSLGLIDNWLAPIRQISRRKQAELAAIQAEDERVSRMCEWNVMAQVVNLGHTQVVMDAWARGQSLSLHGWIYDISDGLLRDLGVTANSAAQLAEVEDR